MHTSAVFVLLVQLALILAASRSMGALAIRIGQPRVVGEMLAGIVLGPSLFGLFAPELWSMVFPADSVALLDVLAQLGVILFLFLIGLELDPSILRNRGQAAFAISNASIVAPFLLGAASTLFLYPILFNDTARMSFAPVALFMGAAMSVTAFPVLARILSERSLQRTEVGVVAISSAALNDVTAWCMLAFVVAIGRAEGMLPGLVTAGLTALYVLGMLYGVRPLLRRLEVVYERQERRTHRVLAMVLLATLLSAAVTELIGIHALFGAFLMGAIMPKGTEFVRAVTGRLEDLVTTFLLPIFFAYAGLRTQIGLLDGPELWWMTAGIVAVACLGKFGGAAIAARVSGMGWRESSAVGILMNTRGLMELVILTIGLEIGVITPAVFAMMVIMALATTVMTTPALHWVLPPARFAPMRDEAAAAERAFRVLVPIARPESGPGLARVLELLDTPGSEPVHATALHLIDPAENESLRMTFEGSGAASDPLGPFLEEAQARDLSAESLRTVTRDRASDIVRAARLQRSDLILMGFHKSVVGRSLLGGTVHRVLAGADADVAILVDRGLPRPLRVLVPYQGSPHDRLAIEIARRMATSPEVSVTILHVVQPKPGEEGRGRLRTEATPGNVQLVVVEGKSGVDAVLESAPEHALAIVGVGEEWGMVPQLFGLRAERIGEEWPGSLLLLRRQRPLEAAEPRAQGQERTEGRAEALGAS